MQVNVLHYLVDRGYTNMNDVVNIISTVGFPIAMCVTLMWYVKDLTAKHQEETKEFTKALNENTTVLEKLCAILHVDPKE